LTATVTGAVLLSGGSDDRADPGPASSSSSSSASPTASADPRGAKEQQPTVAGWKVDPADKPLAATAGSGLTGSVATSRSSGVTKRHKCDSDGKATTFAFKNGDGDFASWSFVGAKGVGEEVPDVTVRKILNTVRLYTPPKDS
jgi:hypothetical protein